LAAEVKITFAPYAYIVWILYLVEFSGMTSSMCRSNIAAIIAKAIPVLPLVGSINFIPGLISPLAKAYLIMLKAGLSLTLPPGF
jgi:hypothetical protein